MDQLRRTKIIATLGPASSSEEALDKMILAGVDVVRLNFSHGTADDHRARIETVRACAKKHNKEVGILADLQGPKIRIAKFKQGKIILEQGQTFVLDPGLDEHAGDEHVVGIDYKALPQDVAPGDILLLDDGRISLEVTACDGTITCLVTGGGELSNNKGINRLGGGLSAEALTEKDKSDIKACRDLDIDYVAISFVRSGQDVFTTRKLLEESDLKVGIISKIERAEAVDVIDEIVEQSDGVMVARGDLGVEIGDAEVPSVQKRIIQRARALDRVVITATQMMESMITNTIPTRAEVSDVANAVIDGTDAVMLSAETATGAHPDVVIGAMARICISAEKHRKTQTSKHRLESEFRRIDEAVAMATMYVANHFKIRAIVALTESGSTPLWMSRIRSGIPIYGLTRHVGTERRMTLFRGVYPVKFDATACTRDNLNRNAIETVRELGLVDAGDYVILTKGDILGVHGGANAMKIVQVGNVF